MYKIRERPKKEENGKKEAKRIAQIRCTKKST